MTIAREGKFLASTKRDPVFLTKGITYTVLDMHSISLLHGDTIKQSKLCREALETAFEVSKLIKFSPKRNAAFDRIKSEPAEEDIGICI